MDGLLDEITNEQPGDVLFLMLTANATADLIWVQVRIDLIGAIR